MQSGSRRALFRVPGSEIILWELSEILLKARIGISEKYH